MFWLNQFSFHKFPQKLLIFVIIASDCVDLRKRISLPKKFIDVMSQSNFNLRAVKMISYRKFLRIIWIAKEIFENKLIDERKKSFFSSQKRVRTISCLLCHSTQCEILFLVIGVSFSLGVEFPGSFIEDSVDLLPLLRSCTKTWNVLSPLCPLVHWGLRLSCLHIVAIYSIWHVTMTAINRPK